MFNRNEPHVGSPAYSPGFPLLLAPFVRLLGLNVIALKSVSRGCMAAAMFLTFMLFREPFGVWVAATVAFPFGLHDFSWDIRNHIASKPCYILWTLAALYCASRPVRGPEATTAVACGTLAHGAFAARPISASLIAAVVLYEIVARVRSRRFLCLAGTPAAGILLQRHFFTLAEYSAAAAASRTGVKWWVCTSP